MPPTPTTTTTTTIDDDRRRDDDDVDEHGAEIFEILDRVDAINLVQKSSKSELSSRFFGRSKFFGCKKVEFLNGRLPTEDGSVRPQTLGKRVSDDARHFIFRCRKNVFWQKFSTKLWQPLAAPVAPEACTGGCWGRVNQRLGG